MIGRSILEGAAQVLDIFGVIDHYRRRPFLSDQALANDWQAVGDDMRKAMGLENPSEHDQNTGPWLSSQG